MTIYDFKSRYETKHPDSHFFDGETLKFFGESLSRMNVLKKTVIIKDKECYVISSKRTKNAFGSCRPYTYYLYFTTDSLAEMFDD